ncbi:glycosyltransferase family 4 protein [Bacillus cereus]
MVFEHANALMEKGHDVVCYTPMRAYKFNRTGILGNFKIIKSSIANTFLRGSKVNWFSLNAPVKLVPCISEKFIRDADVTIATAWPTAYDVHQLSIKKGAKFYFIQGYEVWSGPRNLIDASYKLPLYHITVSDWLKKILADKFSSSNIDVIYNGTDISTDIKQKKYSENKRALMLYHQLESKGFKDGMEAIKIVREKYPNLELTLFGQENPGGLPRYVNFYENPDRELLKKLYEDTDIFIFPSREEGWGLTAIEAMACGCAVVGTNVGCLMEIGVHEKTAMISNPFNIDELAANISSLIEDEELFRSISENGYNRVKEFTWENAANNFEEAIMRRKNS